MKERCDACRQLITSGIKVEYKYKRTGETNSYHGFCMTEYMLEYNKINLAIHDFVNKVRESYVYPDKKL